MGGPRLLVGWGLERKKGEEGRERIEEREERREEGREDIV